MTDRDGTTLIAGDPVLYYHDDDDEPVTATVLREVSDGRYLIQVDPRNPTAGPRLPALTALLDQADSAWRDLGLEPTDVQEPFEVDGNTLEYSGEWGDEADLDENDEDLAD